MLTYTQKELEKILADEFGYNSKEAEVSAEDLLKAGADLQEAFEHYRKDKTIDYIVVEGYTIETIMKIHKMEFPGALLALDWLRREPEKAKHALLTWR